jgi:hypothetical protein
LESELTFEQGLVDQYSLEMTDANKTEADRAFAKEQFEASVETINANNEELARLRTIQELIRGELDEQKARLQGATDFLQEAEDAKARADLDREREAYNEQKKDYDTLKAEYDALVKRDDEEGLNDEDLNKLIRLEGEYFEKKEEYEAVKSEVETKEREANNKAFTKATANQEKTKIAQAEAQTAFDAAKAAAVTAQATYDALIARSETLLKQFNSSQDKNVL